MKLVTISRISTLKFKLPPIPRAIRDDIGRNQVIQNFTNDELRQLGEAWTTELIQTAQARRGAPRGK